MAFKIFDDPEVPIEHKERRPEEILEVTDGYRKMAGFSLQQLHDRPSLAEMQY